jgi:hypothetical protein
MTVIETPSTFGKAWTKEVLVFPRLMRRNRPAPRSPSRANRTKSAWKATGPRKLRLGKRDRRRHVCPESKPPARLGFVAVIEERNRIENAGGPAGTGGGAGRALPFEGERTCGASTAGSPLQGYSPSSSAAPAGDTSEKLAPRRTPPTVGAGGRCAAASDPSTHQSRC